MSAPGLRLAGVLGAALVIRVAMLASALSRLDGDEAVTGIMAQRINEGHHLAFFAGQAYQGSGEQYLQALLLRFLPDTPFTLRLPQVALSVLACAGVYFLALRCLRSEGRALLAAALFAVGPFFSVWWSVKSRGAYDSALVLGLAGLLAALYHAERAVELDVDLAAVVAGDLDLVVALLVADLGVGDFALADVGFGGGNRPVALLAGELGVVVGIGGHHGTGPADHDGDGDADAHHPPGSLVHRFS